VLAATIAELVERGYGGLSVADIADRAGVHRTTVYRRWPDLAGLVTEALLEVGAATVPPPDTGSVRGDLRELVGSIAALIDGDATRDSIRALLGEGARVPVIGAVVRDVWSARFAVGQQVVARWVERGRLRDDVPAATIVSALVAPLYLRLMITADRLDDEFLDDVVELALAGALR